MSWKKTPVAVADTPQGFRLIEFEPISVRDFAASPGNVLVRSVKRNGTTFFDTINEARRNIKSCCGHNFADTGLVIDTFHEYDLVCVYVGGELTYESRVVVDHH